ncbi:serine/threonine protein kinase [Micromonospora fluostatini]|uniref:serine/threonine protein kinase n=1 Tax=Micromonospora sp. JCM 30529 TaxID=3421643 RepID=UPI003D172FC8
MTGPHPPEDATRLDPGRGGAGGGGSGATWSRDDEPDTEQDPGRVRPGRQDVPPWSRRLPDELGARFTVLRELSSGGEGDLYVVRERATGLDRVLKLYRTGWTPDQRVTGYVLRSRRSRHLVRMFEVGTAERRSYEIMEYLAGHTAADLRRRHPDGLGRDLLTAVVRQVTEALAELHAGNIVHRDLKPSNILVRGLDPFEVVLVDIGISRYVDDVEEFTRNRDAGSVRYRPPEFIAGGVISAAYDWWSLGISLFELATGRQMLAGLRDDVALNVRYTTGALDVSALSDERFRLLCRGLLTPDPDERWDENQLRRWLAGESPAVATTSTPPGPGRPTPAGLPYRYLDVDYWYRPELAMAMTETWQTAAALLFGDDLEPDRRLGRWLRQFPDVPTPPGRGRRTSPNVRLLDRLQTVDPARPPVYRNENIAVDRLYDLAHRALGTVGGSADVVRDLWTFDLLPVLSTGSSAPGLSGGEGLREVRDRWRQEHVRLTSPASLAAVTDPDARAELRRLLKDEAPRFHALTLLACVATDDQRHAVRRDLVERARETHESWFSTLVAQPGHLWLAYVLAPFAESTADRKAAEEEAARVRREWLRRTEAVREWSRRQNRPRALSLAVGGVCAMAVVLVMLVGLGDAADVVSDAAIVDAWFAVVASVAVALTVESLLAWTIGGRFRPYSMLVAAAVTVGRLARRVTGRWLALAVVGGLFVGAGLVTAYAPVVTPVAVAVLMVVWTIARYLAWLDEVERERADIAAAET